MTWGKAALALLVVLYLAVCLYPYRFSRPHVAFAANTAVFLPDGTLQFRPPGPGIARTQQPPRWLASAIATGHFDIVLRVRPAAPAQYGPARILTVSFDRRRRNLTVGQQGRDLILRLRTPQTDVNGTPPLRVKEVFAQRGWIDLAVSVRPGRLTIRVQDALVVEETLPNGWMSGWDPSYRLALGSEINNSAGWLGEIATARISTPAMTVDYLRPAVLEIPRVVFVSKPSPKLIPLRQINPHDAIANILGFVPLGLFVGLAGARARRSGRRALLAVLFLFSVSLAIESAQFFTVARQPSVDDLITNTLGGGAGLLAGRWLAGRGFAERWCSGRGLGGRWRAGWARPRGRD